VPYSMASNGHSPTAWPPRRTASSTTSRTRTGAASRSPRKAGSWGNGLGCFAVAVTPHPKWSRGLVGKWPMCSTSSHR
jgi:hypothetical protein